MSTALDFESFPKLHRLRRGCVITEKIDGSNAQVAFTDDGIMHVGSRNRWITPEDDNFGFARWCAEHADDLKLLGPGRHFGEWWGTGIQRRYGLTEKRFSLFNVERWRDGRAPRPACCGVVPILYEGDFSSTAIESALDRLRTEGSVAVPGFMKPEGVVVYLAQARQSFKITLDGDGHKGS